MVQENTTMSETLDSSGPSDGGEVCNNLNNAQQSIPAHKSTYNQPQKLAGVFPSCVAIFLRNKVNLTASESADSSITSMNWLDSDFHSPYLQLSAKEVFHRFVEANSCSTWLPHLQESLAAVVPLGLLYCGNWCLSLLIHSPKHPCHLNVIRESWVRGLLRPPSSFLIENFGEVSPFEMTLVDKSAFLYLPDIVCLSIVTLCENNKATDQASILQYLKESYSGVLSPPSVEQLSVALSNLIKERKVYHSNHGYFITSTNFQRSASVAQPLSFVNQHALGAAAGSATENPSESAVAGNSKCCHNRKSYPLNYHDQPCHEKKPLPVLEHAKHEKEFIEHVCRNEDDNVAKESAYVDMTSPAKNSVNGAPTGAVCRSKFHNNNAHERIVIETASESDVPRNCVQSFSKIFGKYKHNKKKGYSLACSNKTLVTFNTQFPPIGESSPNIKANRGDFNSNHSSCRADYESIGVVNDENSLGVGFHKVEFLNVDCDARDRLEMVKHGTHEETVRRTRRRSRRRSPRFVAYLPEDYTGSDSIVKCPINTPKWAKEGNCGNRASRKYYNNYRRHVSSGPRIEYSHHNYFHHSRRFRSKSANRRVLYSSFSTSDGMTKAVTLSKQRRPAAHLQSRGVQSDDSGNPELTCKRPTDVLHRLSLPNAEPNGAEMLKSHASPTNCSEKGPNRKSSSPGDPCQGDPREKTAQTTFVITTSTYHCQNSNKSTPSKPCRTPRK